MAHASDRMEIDEADEQPPTGDAWLTRQMQQRAQRMHSRRTGSSGSAPVPPPDVGHGQQPSDPKHEYGAHAATAVQHEQLEATIARRKERIAALEAQLANERAQLAADEADLADLTGMRPDPQAAAAAAEQERLDMELARQLQIQADRDEEQQAAEAEEQERRRAREEARAHAQMPAAFGLPQGFGSGPGTHFAVQRHPNGGMSFSFSSSSSTGQPHGGGGGMGPTGPSAMDEHAARHRAHVERMMQDMARLPMGMPSGFSFGMPPNFGGGFGGGGGFGFGPDAFAGFDVGELPQGQQTFRQPARPEDVERLPEARYQAAPAAPAAADEAGAAQEEDESRKCAICLQKFEDGDTIRRLPCLHIFHRDEIDRWLRESHVCPICRTPIEQDDSSA